MTKGKLLISEQIAGALRRACGEPEKTMDPVNLNQQAEEAVIEARQVKTPPFGLLEEETGKYVLIFPYCFAQVSAKPCMKKKQHLWALRVF